METQSGSPSRSIYKKDVEAPKLAEKDIGSPTTRTGDERSPSPDAKSLQDTPNQDDPSDEPHRTTTSGSRASTKPAMPLGREVVFVTVVCCAQLFTQACFGQAIAIISYIGPSFGELSPGQLSWFPAAFSLTAGTFIIIAGRLGDMFGHKTMFLIGWSWMALWSLLAGLSAFTHEQIFFDVCRAMQGLGSAILLPCSLAILGRTYPAGARKNMVFAIYGATAPNGFIIGALFSGLMAQLVWWPWAYWLSAIAATCLAVLAQLVVPGPGDGESSIGPQSFDWLGAVTGVAGLVLFNVAWNQAPIVGWQEPYVIVLLILGAGFLVVFVLVERRVRQPLLPVSGFSSTVAFVLGCISLGWASFGIWVFYFWRIQETLRGLSPLGATAQNVPAGPMGIVAALMTGFLLSRVRPELIMFIAMCMFCTGNVLIATMDPSQIYWAETFLACVFTPFGMDMSFPAATLILSNSMPKRHQGIAASLVVTVVNYSISIGLGIGGTVESRINKTGNDLLKGYRAALYAGIGLAGCGILLAVVFIVYNAHVRKRGKWSFDPNS